MVITLLSLIPLIGWGSGDYLASRGTGKLNPISLSLWMSIVGSLSMIVVGLSFGAPELTAFQLSVSFLSSICFSSGFIIMLKAFKYGPVGIVAPIANAYALFTTLAAVLFFNVKLSTPILVGILTVVIGVSMVSYSKPKPGEFKNEKLTIILSIVALCFFGSGFLLLDRASRQEWYQNLVILQLTGLLVSILFWLILQKINRIQDLKKAVHDPLYSIAGLVGGIGLLGMTAALERADNIAVPTAIAAASPLVTALMAYIFNDEHLTVIQRYATVIIVGGIIMLSL